MFLGFEYLLHYNYVASKGGNKGVKPNVERINIKQATTPEL